MYKKLTDLPVTNYLTQRLNADIETPGSPFLPSKNIPASTARRQVFNAHFSYVQPDPSPNPKLVSFNPTLASEIGLDPSLTNNPDSKKDLIETLSGNTPYPGSNAWALCYGGHQFGSWAGQLGDGRAVSLVQTKTTSLFELQIKGAGLTPYSRFGDGFAVVRSSIQEYFAAEAMYALGVPTSRSLALITT